LQKLSRNKKLLQSLISRKPQPLKARSSLQQGKQSLPQQLKPKLNKKLLQMHKG